MERMIEALRLMACSADEQIAALPDFVVVADEIALTFDEVLRGLALDSCAPTVRAGIIAIDRRLTEMSGPTQPFWTIDALRTASEWAELRTAAAAILEELGVAVGPPDLSWLTFVSGA